MTTRLHVLNICVVVLFLAEGSAEAYVDPGVASYAFQIIAGAVLGGLFLVRTYWNRMVTVFRSVVGRDAARGR